MFKKKEIEYNFKNKHTFEQRSIESNKIKIKYPDKIPVIVEKAKSSKIITIDKNTFRDVHNDSLNHIKNLNAVISGST